MECANIEKAELSCAINSKVYECMRCPKHTGGIPHGIQNIHDEFTNIYSLHRSNIVFTLFLGEIRIFEEENGRYTEIVFFL